MLFMKKENYNNVEMLEIAKATAKKVITKEKSNIVNEFEKTINLKIEECIKNKLEEKTTKLKCTKEELEREYYYEKGKEILTEEKGQQLKSLIDNIDNKLKKIEELKELLDFTLATLLI